MWVVGILRLLSETTDETIGGRLVNVCREEDPGEGESGRVALVECDAPEMPASDHGRDQADCTTIRCETTELGERLTALWEDGYAMSIVGLDANAADGGDEHLEYLDLAVIEVDALRFDATNLGSVLARLDRHPVPFFFLMSGLSDGGEISPEIPVTLAQFGTVCPFSLPATNHAADLRRVRDYVRQRLDKQYGPREGVSDAKSTGAERRAFPRWHLDRPAIAKIAGRIHSCRVVDISGGGLSLDLPNACMVGDDVIVTLEAVRPLRGKVVHVGLRHVGVQFTMDAAEHSEALVLIAQVVDGRAHAAE